jgi:sporulation protein YlmC with PRC-barrel domain
LRGEAAEARRYRLGTHAMARNCPVPGPFLVQALETPMYRTSLNACAFVLAAALTWLAPGPAQALTRAEIIEDLIGAPVFASDGIEVGTVLDVSTDTNDEIDAISMSTARVLGFGERIVDVPNGAFMVLRGAIVLDIPAESVEGLLPSADAEP